MCLGVPGRVVRVDENPAGLTMGIVAFGGISKEICLAYTPEAVAGDYVLVHAGFAISKIDEEHARDVFEALRQMGELTESDDPTQLTPAG